MKISDEMVERAIRGGTPSAKSTHDPVYQLFDMRAALEAVAPMIRAAALKEAAKMIEKKHTNNVGMVHPMARSDAAADAHDRRRPSKGKSP